MQSFEKAGLLGDDGQGASLLCGAHAVDGLDPEAAGVINGYVLDGQGMDLPNAVLGNFGGVPSNMKILLEIIVVYVLYNNSFKFYSVT